MLVEWGRSGVDIDDDADAAASRGIERERDARRRSVTDEALVVVEGPAREEDDRGDVGHVARLQRGEAGQQLVEGSRRERSQGRGPAHDHVAALVVNYEFLMTTAAIRADSAGQEGISVETP